MSLLQKINSAIHQWTKPSIKNITYSDSIMEAFGVTPGAAGMSVNANSAMRVSAANACVQKISGAILSLPIHIYKTDGDINYKLPRDELWYRLNEEPHEQYSAASWWESVSCGQLLRGDSYSWIRRSLTNKILEILPLPWGAVTPTRKTDGAIVYYINLPEFKITTWLESSDVLHFPGLGFDGMRSSSVIAYAARQAIGNALAMDSYAGKFFEGGAHPSIILSSPGVMNPEQIAGLQTAFAAKYAGNYNAHRLPMVLTEGLVAKEVSINAEDSQLLESRKFQVIDIARAFGVPPHMIGETSASTSWGSGIESMSRGFVTYTLQPWLRKIEQELNRKLFPKDATQFLRFDREALIEGDSAAQAVYNRAALGGPGTGQGWLTVDEVRKQKGLAPLGGDAAKIFNPMAGATA